MDTTWQQLRHEETQGQRGKPKVYVIRIPFWSPIFKAPEAHTRALNLIKITNPLGTDK
jgi:hypothetical protein